MGRPFAALLLFVLTAGSAAAGTGMAAAGIPLSARQQASGGIYGDPDVLGVAANPAQLSTQLRRLEVGVVDQYLFGSAENVLGLGIGGVTGSADAWAWGAAAVVSQVSTRGFRIVDEIGDETGERVEPVARRADLAVSCQRGRLAGGIAFGAAAESYGSLGDGGGSGPSMIQAAAGMLVAFDTWHAGAAIRLGLSDTPRGAGGADSVNLGGAADAGGLRLTGSLVVPLAGPAGPDAQAGVRWMVSGAFDLRAAYATAFTKGVGAAAGSSVRAGVSFRSDKGMGMDYTLVVPLEGGLGVTNLIGARWTFGDRSRRTPPLLQRQPQFGS